MNFCVRFERTLVACLTNDNSKYKCTIVIPLTVLY